MSVTTLAVTLANAQAQYAAPPPNPAPLPAPAPAAGAPVPPVAPPPSPTPSPSPTSPADSAQPGTAPWSAPAPNATPPSPAPLPDTPPAQVAPAAPLASPEVAAAASTHAAIWPGDEFDHQLLVSVPMHFTEDGGTYAGPSALYRGRAKSLSIGIEIPFAYADDEKLGGSSDILLANPVATLRLDVLDSSTLRLDAGFGVALPLAAIDRSSSFAWRQGAAALGGVADLQGLWDVWRYRPESLGLFGVFGVRYLAGTFEMRLDTGAGFILANGQNSSVANFVVQQRAAFGYRTARLGVGTALTFAQLVELSTPAAQSSGPFVATRPLKDSERNPGELSAEPYVEFTPGRGLVRLAFSVGIFDNVENATGEAYDEAVGDPIETPWSMTLGIGSRF